ncbi:hypothetical protein ABK040_016630 [Willaertia magna]
MDEQDDDIQWIIEKRKKEKKGRIILILCIILIACIVIGFTLAVVITKFALPNNNNPDNNISESEIITELTQECTLRLITIGTSGGLIESDLTSLLIGTNTSKGTFLSLDAGNLLSGLKAFTTSTTNSKYNSIFYKVLLSPNAPIDLLKEYPTTIKTTTKTTTINNLKNWNESLVVGSLSKAFGLMERLWTEIVTTTLEIDDDNSKTKEEEEAANKEEIYLSLAGYILRQNIVGYFIGHSHLDHLNGLIISSALGSYLQNNISLDNYYLPKSKSIIGNNNVINAIQKYLFNDIIWPNIPLYTNWYSYQTIDYLKSYSVNDLLYNNTKDNNGDNQLFNELHVQFFELCHDVPSTAFLFTHKFYDLQLLYFSDTGFTNNNCNYKDKINTIWKYINIEKLKVILIEISFPNSTPDNQLYGHLRPKDLIGILKELKLIMDLKQVSIFITHIKPTFPTSNVINLNIKKLIKQELLTEAEQEGIESTFIFPTQGQLYCFN